VPPLNGPVPSSVATLLEEADHFSIRCKKPWPAQSVAAVSTTVVQFTESVANPDSCPPQVSA